jgi:HlyD family secretion protein
LRRALAGVVALALLAAAGYAIYYFTAGRTTQPTYRFAKIERGALSSVVSATGTINPVTTVQVGSQVSGQIKEVLVDFNTEVRKDQIIARLDPQTLELKVSQTRADLESARASVEVARAGVAQQRAELARVRVTLNDAERTYNRNRDLMAKNFISQAEVDKSQTAFDGAREQLNAVQAQINTSEAQVKNAQAVIRQREAQLRQSQVDLERTIIRAPVDGTVILRNVDAGQTVAASLQAPVLFTIARDLREMQVDTSVDEADVGRLRVGQAATFTVDAFQRRSFEGKITQIRKAAQVQQNVVTYTVVVSTANQDLTLLPGMTANVRVVVEARDNVLKVPNAALRFRPQGTADAAGASKGGAAKSGPPGAGGGPPPGAQAAMQFRQRVLTELNLDEGQKATIERIFDEARGRGAALREIADEGERRKAAERSRAETRARILEALKPEQRPLYERLAAEAFGGRASTGRVWMLDSEKKPKAIEVRLGITDGATTELVSGDVQEGAEIIVGASGGAPATGGGSRTPGSPPMIR